MWHEAPPHPTWDRALLATLSHGDAAVRAAGLEACLTRLDHFRRTDLRAHDDFFDHLTTYCLHTPEGGREQVQTRLFRTLADYVTNKPALETEHLRSRLLARTRDVLYLPLPALFAREIVRVQWRLIGEEGCSAGTTLALYEHRRRSAYTTPGVRIGAILAYLDQDRRLPARHVDGALFDVYGRLLATHARAGYEAVMVQAFANLDRWLADLPHTAEQRRAATPDLVQARRNETWGGLDRDVALHLAGHAALVPGADHGHDLVRLLQAQYMPSEGESVLLAGLQVLTHLPGLRARLPELLEMLKAATRPGCSPLVGQAVLGLLEGLLVGLPEADPGAAPDEIEQAAARDNRLSQQRARVLRRRLLEPDRIVQRALEALSRDEAAVPDARTYAWRILVRSELPHRDERLREALASPDHPYFLHALDVAVETRHRAVGRVLEHHWPHLVAGDAATPGRRERLERLCAAVAALRLAAFVRRPGGTPPLIALALDDPDPDVRRAATEAIHRAGFAAAMDREYQRRTLESVHEHLTSQAHEANRLEQQLSELGRTLLYLQVEHDDLAHEMQGALREREALLAEGWTSAARFETEIYDIQKRLAGVLEHAEIHATRLHELKQNLQRRLDRDGEEHQTLDELLRQRTHLMQEIERRRQQATEAAATAADARDQLATLQAAPPQPATEDERRRHHTAWMRQVESLRETVAQHRAQADEHRSRITALTNEVERLAAAMDGAQVREQDLNAHREELAAHEQQGGDMQREIARLEAHIRDVQQQGDAAHRDRAQRLEAAARRLADYERQLADLEGRIQDRRGALTAAQAALTQCRTEVQQAMQELEHGRQQYEALGEHAASRSLHADRQGLEEARHAEEQRRGEQESLLWYAYNIDQALRRLG